MTSLPGPWGIGELGSAARQFAKTLRAMGQSIWQILPLGLTGAGDSPYQSPSTFAGNHLLISLDDLVADGLLDPAALRDAPAFPADRVDFEHVTPWRMNLLKAVCQTFDQKASDRLRREFASFCRREEGWLEDYALFMAIRAAFGGRPAVEWPEPLRLRFPAALALARQDFAAEMQELRILQFLFHRQWARLHAHCRRLGLRIVGDLPIFVAPDSVDVWAHPELFFVDENGRPTVQAGVPPDYFCATGQLWGNPLYDWNAHRRSGYAWWLARLRKTLEWVDIVRIDHFRGFDQYWEVPAGERTAEHGRWVNGPRSDFFNAVVKEFGKRPPILAEDLGIITKSVERLRDRFGFPGMRVIQFSFKMKADEDMLEPHEYPVNCYAYTGTHDNDTAVGWATQPSGGMAPEYFEKQRIVVNAYLHEHLGRTPGEIHWDLIGLGLRSPAAAMITPLQDVLGLGSAARMNIPGQCGGLWSWRFQPEMLTPEIQRRLRQLTVLSRRTPR